MPTDSWSVLMKQRNQLEELSDNVARFSESKAWFQRSWNWALHGTLKLCFLFY